MLGTFDLSTLQPTVRDPLQYPAGAHVGVDVAADVWEVPAGGYLLSGANIYGSGESALSIWGGSGASVGGRFVAAHRATVPPDHFVAGQCIVPLSDAAGCYPAVRVDVATGSAYALINMGYETEMSWTLARVGPSGVGAVLAYWSANAFSDPAHGATTNNFWIDGQLGEDGHFAILEVEGTDPVTIRCSVAVNLHNQPTGSAGFTDFPTEIPSGITTGLPAVHVLGVVVDSAPSRLTAGRAGLYSTGASQAGAFFNFNAGATPTLTGRLLARGGNAATLGGSRPIGRTITVT